MTFKWWVFNKFSVPTGKFGPSQGDDGLLSFIGLICIVHLCPAMADASWCSPNLILTWKNTLDDPPPPLTVFARCPRRYRLVGIMCKYCARWFLSDPTAAGHWHATLLMTKRVHITPNEAEMRSTPLQNASYIASNQLSSHTEDLIFMQMRELVCVSVRISLHMSHMSLSRRKKRGRGVIRWRSTAPFSKKEVSIDWIHHYTTLQRETFFF